MEEKFVSEILEWSHVGGRMRGIMKNNKSHTGIQKDKLFMIAASVFILTAFTMTGVYVADSNKQEQDGYLIDFSELEGQVKNENKAIDNEKKVEKEQEEKPAAVVNSGKVENPVKEIAKEEVPEDAQNEITSVTEKTERQEMAMEDAPEQAKVYSFSEQDTLAWPVVGNVLLDYSMDKAIYYQTMQQYRYNPAVVIAAKEDEPITAAADARVISVFQDAEIGKGVIFELGNGYELTYGQLKGVTVKEGDAIRKGDLVGYISKPTIYYSEEGSNLYVKLTKDGVPIDPLQNMKEVETE